MNNLGKAYQEAGKLERALPLLEETLALRKSKSGPDHRETLTTMHNLALGYQAAGKLDRALPLFEEVVRRSRKQPLFKVVAPLIAKAYTRAGQTGKAAALAREILAEARASMPAGSPQLANVMARVGRTLLTVRAWNEAEPVLREALAIREAKDPDAWTTFNTKSMLGEALLGQKKYADAEPLLRAGYEGMKQRAEKIPPQGRPRLVEALDRLIDLAEATNRPDDVKRWKDEKAKLPGASAPTPEAKKP
jgi:tetratricopeptide (TPR) repeat protein